jgi:hypothetical protein
MLQVSRSDVEKWLKEWDITPTEKSAFLKTLVAVFSKAGQQYVPRLLFYRLDSHLLLLTYPPFLMRAETRPTTTSSRSSAR